MDKVIGKFGRSPITGEGFRYFIGEQIKIRIAY